MNWKTFDYIISMQIAHNKKVRALYNLKVDLIETFEEQESAIQMLWQSVLTEYGYDWLTWYLYEKDGISGKPRKDLDAHDEDDAEICKNLKDLYKYLSKNNYFKTSDKS
jgi:hypothetical protein